MSHRLFQTCHNFADMIRLICFARYAAVIICLTVSCCPPVQAKKIYTSLCGRIYMRSGDSIIADGKLRLSVPLKNKKLEVISHAYTGNNEIQSRISPEDVDSVVLWTSTAPQRPHIFKYINKFGWCWQLDSSPYLSVYCYAPKGYYCAGNGGLWTYGKNKMFIVKGGEIYVFGQHNKVVDKKMRAKLETIVADDVRCLEYVRTAKGRADKVLRGLVMYNPKK